MFEQLSVVLKSDTSVVASLSMLLSKCPTLHDRISKVRHRLRLFSARVRIASASALNPVWEAQSCAAAHA
jgi:hypothetical protein